MKTKIDIFSGFLGAGKTMLIKKLLSEKLQNENIVIIENEFGEVGIDGSILRKSNIEVKEINAGCICCTVSSDFNEAIKEVIEKYKPSRIIIEPSGVGKLSDVINVCKGEQIKKFAELNMIITVVDGLKYDAYIKNFSEFYKNQIQNANTLVISRSQKLSLEKLVNLVEKLQKINHKAKIITTPWDSINGAKIVTIGESKNKEDNLEGINLVKKPIGTARVNTTLNHKANEVFQTVGIETPKVFDRISLQNFLERMEKNKAYGTVIRAKGIVETEENKWIQFDYVPEEFQIRDSHAEYTGRVCIIGSGLNKEAIRNLFLSSK
ncbi:GTP-binding protein [Clostridium sp.]|uniref:CobW family GTP-binding protein n=1 Tax=Clostridium sp. TaxID=1506 RepID=UPI002FC691B0